MNPSPTLPPSLTFIERDWLSANHLLGRSDTANVLVDSGYCSRRDMTLQLVARALGTAPLHRVVNTHTHSDHVGGNAALKARYGCRIAIPVQAREAVARWQEDKLHYSTLGQTCDRFAADEYFDRGDSLDIGGMPWQALGSPRTPAFRRAAIRRCTAGSTSSASSAIPACSVRIFPSQPVSDSR